MISASKSTLSLNNLRILRTIVAKNLTNFCKKFCESPPCFLTDFTFSSVFFLDWTITISNYVKSITFRCGYPCDGLLCVDRFNKSRAYMWRHIITFLCFFNLGSANSVLAPQRCISVIGMAPWNCYTLYVLVPPNDKIFC